MDDMPMGGTPWIMYPIELYSSREYECTLNNTELCEYQQGYWRFWYEADHRYALPTIALFSVGITFFALAYVWNVVAPRRIKQAPPVKKVTAIGRYLSYRSFRIDALNWNSAPIGLLLLAVVGTVFFFSMVLGPRPYYWPSMDSISWGDSPPLATRSGWMALACMPFVFATAGKSNFITMVTGVSHEKLQVFHRWIAYAFFVLALLHTFPFIVYNIKMKDMIMTWQTNFDYWTGVVALLAQAWLTFASFSPLRNLCYEFFKFTHFLAGLVFAVFLFIHCDFTLTSVDYFIATGVLFALSWLHSHIRTFFEHGIGSKARVEMTDNGFIRVSVPSTTTWTAGQHYFVRFLSLGLQATSAHPFTVCSLPNSGSSYYDVKESEIVFYIRPQGGYTARLARYAASRPNATTRIFLDGPYGGIDMRKIAQSDRSIVVAGGSGAGWMLPLIESHLRRLRLAMLKGEGESDDTKSLTGLPSMKAILATRDMPTRHWFENAVSDLVKESSVDAVHSNLEVEIHYTGEPLSSSSFALSTKPKTTSSSQNSVEDVEKAAAGVNVVAKSTASGSEISSRKQEEDSSSSNRQLDVEEMVARPNLPQIISAEAAAVAHDRSSLGIFVCGPSSMQSDVGNAAAAQQLAVMKSGAGEIYLHMEHFSWA